MEEPLTSLYFNDGTGNFELSTTSDIENSLEAGLLFVDVDNDGDDDLITTGETDNSLRSAKLYINDGSGDFSLSPDEPFDTVSASDMAAADVDNDGDQDIIIAGYNGRPSAFLYINDGNGEFEKSTTSELIGVNFSTVDFADVDGDGDQDVMITGYSDDDEDTATLYLNNGSGVFVEDVESEFAGVTWGSVAFADVDGDDDQDVMIAGRTTSYLYINNGSGGFTLSTNDIEGVSKGSVAFADVDNDADLDMILLGRAWSGNGTRLYLNDGSGNYTEYLDVPFDKLSDGAVAFADVDGDNDQDLLITGNTSEGTAGSTDMLIAKLYRNDGLVNTDDLSDQATRLQVFPNPSNGQNLNLQFDAAHSASATIRVNSMLGETVMVKTLNLSAGLNTTQ